MQTAGGLLKWLSNKRSRARAPALGARELVVLEILWEGGALSAQQVLERISGGSISLSTVQSTLERLQRKQIVERNKRCRAFYYSARVARSDLIHLLLEDITHEIAGGDLAYVVSGFMQYLDCNGTDGRDALTVWREKSGVP